MADEFNGHNQIITYTSSLSDFTSVNSSFDSAKMRICYPGLNRNNSHLSIEAIKSSLKTISYVPIVCNYIREEDKLGGHDFEIVKDDDGGLHTVNLTYPVGVVPENPQNWFEEHTDKDGVNRRYLCIDVLLWKRQEAYKLIKRDGIVAQSMEIRVKDSEIKDGVLYIKDFEFTAFALIGVEPCYEGAALETFSLDGVKRQITEMMTDLKDYMLTANTVGNNIQTEGILEEGEKADLKKKIELAEKYGIDVNGLDFSIDDYTIEELTERFEAMTSEADTNGGGGDGSTDDGGNTTDDGVDDFALNSNIVNEVSRVLSSEKIHTEYGELRPRYSYVDIDTEKAIVYALDRTDWLLYGFAYTMNGDAAAIDFATKTRKKFEIVDFDGGEQDSPFATEYELMANAFASLKETAAKAEDDLKDMTEKYEASADELDKLREFKRTTEERNAEIAREEVFAAFTDLVGNDDFESLRENAAKFDVDTITEKCYAIRGRILGNTAKFNLSGQNNGAPKLVVGVDNEGEPEPYGGLFKEFPRRN